MTAPSTYFARLHPVDAILFGDNRSARAGMDHLQLDQDPPPLTFHGALGTFVWQLSGGSFPKSVLGEKVPDILEPGGHSVAELLGIVLRDPNGGLWFPKPLHLRCRKSTGTSGSARFRSEDLLTPRKPGQESKTSCPLDAMLDAPPLSDEADEALLIKEDYLAQVLSGRIRRGPVDQQVCRPDDIFCSDLRPGIVIQNKTGTTEEGMFFFRPYRRFRGAALSTGEIGWGFGGWFATPGGVSGRGSDLGLGFLGGDRRRARIELEEIGTRDKILASVRELVVSRASESSGFLTYMMTPRIVEPENPWPRIDGSPPIAAATGRAQFVSGWNTALHQPRRLVSLEPAGSVHFFSWAPEADQAKRRRIIEQHWLHPVGPGGAAGFGRVLVGVWS